MARQPFTPQQLEVRRPVWLGLAELFLDTDTRPGLPALALTLAQSGLPETELKGIWEHEVTPLLHANLHSVAGEWASWDEGWLLEQLQARGMLRVGWPPLQRLRYRLRVDGLDAYFQSALGLTRHLLALPPEERQAQAAAWAWLARVYFWPDTPGLPEPPPGPDLSACFRALEPRLRPLLTPQEPPERHRLHVLKLLGQA